MKKYIIISLVSFFSIVILIITFLSGSFDVVKSEALSSFNDLLISGISKSKKGSSWILTMPDKMTKISFEDSTAMMVLDLKPFLNAGLNVRKLPNYITYNLDSNELYIKKSYSKTKSTDKTINDLYINIIDNNRDKLGYHQTLNHFGLSFDNGNLFEYAKNINDSDKDIVIALNPEIFINMGVDVSKLDGYVYTDVKMDNGQVVKKLLKVFNLEEVNQCLITEGNC